MSLDEIIRCLEVIILLIGYLACVCHIAKGAYMTSYTECSFCKCQKWCRLYDGHIKGKKYWYYACDDCVSQIL